MSHALLAAAMQRVEAAFKRRPAAGLHDDEPASARWDGGTRVVSSAAGVAQISTDMPVDIGGSGGHMTPGWLMRAGLASCAATRIVMSAAAAGITLDALEVVARSRSDARGLLGMPDADGSPVFAGPGEVQLLVRIRALGIGVEQLQALVEHSHRCSPVSAALQAAVPVALHIEVDAA